MKSLLLFAVAASVSVAADLSSTRLDSAAAAVESKVIAWRRDLHEHLELGNREFRTSARDEQIHALARGT